MRARLPLGRAVLQRARSVPRALDRPARPFASPLEGEPPGSADLEEWEERARRLGHDFRRVAAGGGSPRRGEDATGMPDDLKAGVEGLSGVDLSDVRVRYGSPEPARIHARAFARGREIHLSPGHEKLLPHEAWHVVQQKQGRVRPNFRFGPDLPVGFDPALEREADVMGEQAASGPIQPPAPAPAPSGGEPQAGGVLQGGFLEWLVRILALSAAAQGLAPQATTLPQGGQQALPGGYQPPFLPSPSGGNFTLPHPGGGLSLPFQGGGIHPVPDMGYTPYLPPPPKVEPVRPRTGKSKPKVEAPPPRKPPPTTRITGPDKLEFGSEMDRRGWEAGGGKRAHVETKAIKDLLRTTETGKRSIENLEELEINPLVFRQDLPFSQGGEAELRPGNTHITVNENHSYYKNAIIAAHEFKHQEQFKTGIITKESDPYDMAAAEIPAKIAGLKTYRELRDQGHIGDNDRDTMGEEAELADYEEDAAAYKRGTFRRYLAQYRRGTAEAHPDFESDEDLDAHLDAQRHFAEARRRLFAVEQKVKKMGKSLEDYTLPEDLRKEIQAAKLNVRNARKRVKETKPKKES